MSKLLAAIVIVLGLVAPVVMWTLAVHELDARQEETKAKWREFDHSYLRALIDLGRLQRIAYRHGLTIGGKEGELVDLTPPTREGRFEKRWAELIEALRIQGISVVQREDGTILVGPITEPNPSVAIEPAKMPDAERQQLEKLEGIRR